MHEASLVHSLLCQVERLLAAHGGTSVESIRVEMGPLTGVERKLLELAFEAQVNASACRGATLEVEEIPLTAVCRCCRRHFSLDNFRFQCSSCKSQRVQVTGGDQLRLLDVSIQVDETAPDRKTKNERLQNHSS